MFQVYLTAEDYLSILRQCPTNTQLAHDLYTPRHTAKSPLPLGSIVKTLTECDNTQLAMDVMESIQMKADEGNAPLAVTVLYCFSMILQYLCFNPLTATVTSDVTTYIM
jgi:hypothetical protein